MVDRDRQFCYSRAYRARARSFLPGSACRHAARTVSSGLVSEPLSGVQSLRGHDAGRQRTSLLIVRTRRIFTAARMCAASSAGYSEFPANSQIYRQQGFTVSRRSEPSSRTALTGEQPDPWDLLQPQDATSRHRGAKPFRRCGLLGRISLLSPAYLLSVDRQQFHAPLPDHYGLLSHLLDLSVSQSSSLMPLRSTHDFQPC